MFADKEQAGEDAEEEETNSVFSWEQSEERPRSRGIWGMWMFKKGNEKWGVKVNALQLKVMNED